MFPANYLFAMPGLGDFAEESDRRSLHPAMSQIVDSHLQSLWQQGDRQLFRARVLAGMRGKFLATHKQQCESETAAQDDILTFCRRFRFGSIHDTDKTGLGPVHCAAIAGNLPLLRQLAAARADMNEATRVGQPDLLLHKGQTPLMFASFFNGDPTVLSCLLELRASMHAQNSEGDTAISFAASAGHAACIELLLDQGFDPNSATAQGVTPLCAAAACGQVTTVEALLKRGASPNMVLFTGLIILMMAVISGSLPCCRILLEHRANVNAVARPSTALGATVCSLLRFARPFLGEGGPVHLLSISEGATALLVAAALGQLEVLNLLLEANADPSVRNRLGLDALAVAQKLGHTAVVASLSTPSWHRHLTI